MSDEQQFCACGRIKPSCDESRAGCFDGQPMTEKLAYKWAHQCLRDDMGIQQHHLEQLLDRIASAVVESAKRERALHPLEKLTTWKSRSPRRAFTVADAIAGVWFVDLLFSDGAGLDRAVSAHDADCDTAVDRALKEAELAAALKAPGFEAVLTESLYPGLTYAKTDK